MKHWHGGRMRPAGFEPATYCLEGSCSIQMSYDLKTGHLLTQIWCNHTIGTKKSQPIVQIQHGNYKLQEVLPQKEIFMILSDTVDWQFHS